MKHKLSLTLKMLEQRSWGFRFGLILRNESAANLLLPYPEIHGLRFANKATMRESEWYTSILQSTDWVGFTLQPGYEKAIDYRVRPCDVPCPFENDFTDYSRWCVDLPPG